MTRRYADSLIGSSVVVETINENNCSQKPANESQARPLTKLSTPELQQEAWQKENVGMHFAQAPTTYSGFGLGPRDPSLNLPVR